AGARVDQEVDRPRRERHVAAAAGPVADQAVGVYGRWEPLEDVAHRARRGLLPALLGEHAAELAEREERRGAAESLLGAAVRVALEEVEAGRHSQQRRLVGDEHRAAHGAGPRGLGDRGQCDRRAGAPSPSTMRPMPAAVNASPGRTKRGSAGCTTTGRRTATSPVAKPKRWGPLIALARSLKLVRLSGSATCTVATPSGPTSIVGL